MPQVVIYISAAMLFLGSIPLPYGYYMLLRLVACGVFAYAAFVSYIRKNQTLPWVYGLLAVLFNPLIKIHLPKEVWMVVDVGAGILLLATANVIGPEIKQEEERLVIREIYNNLSPEEKRNIEQEFLRTVLKDNPSLSLCEIYKMQGSKNDNKIKKLFYEFLRDKLGG